MKQIIIFLLIVIVAIMGFNMYSKYKRFSFTEYEYKIPEDLDMAAADKAVMLDYYQAVESVNGYVIMQWSANRLDVRNPKDDNAATKAAVNTYRDKLATIAYFEALLRNPKKKTKKGQLSDQEHKKQLIRKEFYATLSANQLNLGDQNALIYEVQKLLNAQGASVQLDGLFRAETFNAIMAFEEKNGLFVDGKLDAITFEYLLK
jgi:hypothetical protein